MTTKTVIVSFARTPITKFRGSLATVSAPDLGSVAIKGAVARTQFENLEIVEALMGNVVSAGIGQAPCRQAGKFTSILGGLTVLRKFTIQLCFTLGSIRSKSSNVDCMYND